MSLSSMTAAATRLGRSLRRRRPPTRGSAASAIELSPLGRRARCGSSLRPNGAFASPAECRGQGSRTSPGWGPGGCRSWARGVSISSWANGACGEQRRHDSDRMMLGLRYSTYPPLRRSSARILCSSSLLLRLTRRRARCTGPFLYLRLFMAIALFLS